MTSALEAFQEALVGGADDDALDLAAADVHRDHGAAALVEAIKMRIAHDLQRGKSDVDVTGLKRRLASALEEVAKTATATKEGASAAIEAAQLYKDVLGDVNGANRNVVHACKNAALDDASLKRVVEVIGGREAAEGVLGKTLKKPEVKEDAPTTAALRRALSRIAEQAGDKDGAFFESLKAARKNPSDGVYIDDVFRLALETNRHTEASAFFGALADDTALSDRHRATLYNKLGQTLEKQGEKQKALEAFTKSVRLHEAKAARRAVDRLAAELGVEPPGDASSSSSSSQSQTPAQPKIGPSASASTQQRPINWDEPVDVTPPYDHKTGTVTQEPVRNRERPTLDSGRASPIDSAKSNPSAAPAEVTIPRFPLEPLPPSMRTQELPDAPPKDDVDAKADATAPVKAPEVKPLSEEPGESLSALVRRVVAEVESPSSTPDASGPPVAGEPDPTAAIPTKPRPISVPPSPASSSSVAASAAAAAAASASAAASAAAPATAAASTSPPLQASASDAAAQRIATGQRAAIISGEQPFSIANLPSFDDQPAVTASATVPSAFEPIARVEVPSFDGIIRDAPADPADLADVDDDDLPTESRRVIRGKDDAGGAGAKGGNGNAAAAANAVSARDTPVNAAPVVAGAVADWNPRPSSPFSIDSGRITAKQRPAAGASVAEVEAKIAKLPDRSEATDEPTRRAPHATITAVNSVEQTGEQAPHAKSRAERRAERSRKEKKEKTQKRKKPIAPNAPRVLVDNSQLDGAPMPPPTPMTSEGSVSQVRPQMVAAAKDDSLPPELQGADGDLGVDPTPDIAKTERSDDAKVKLPHHFVAPTIDDRKRTEENAAHVEKGADDAHEDSVEIRPAMKKTPAAPPTALPAVAKPVSPHASLADAPRSEEGAHAPAPSSSSSSSLGPHASSQPVLMSLSDLQMPSAEAPSIPPPGDDDAVYHPPVAARAGDDDNVDVTPPLPKPHSLGHSIAPPPGESTERGSAAPGAAGAPNTVEAMPPLAEAKLSVPSMEASGALARALAALDSNDADECAAAAAALAAEAPADPRVLRLASRAMVLSAESGQMPKEAVDLFVAQAPKHGDRAAQMALEVQAKLPPATRRAYTHVWIAGAKAAGLDVTRVMSLLREVAIDDATDGAAFEFAERVLVEVNDAAARDALYQSALRALSDRPDGKETDRARRELTKRRLGLLENTSKFSEALQLHSQLAVDLASGDVAIRAAARRAFAQHGTPDERARFLGRLGRKLPGDEGIEVVQELLDVRMSVDDRIGAEAAAKDLLARRPGDGRATKVLADLLDEEPHRIDELVDVLRVGAQQALSWFGKTGEARTLLERLAAVQERAGRPEEAADAYVQVARLVPDDKNLDRALAALDAVKRHKESVALLEEVASNVADAAFRCRCYLRAADIARAKLQKRGKARELVEKSLDLMPRDKAALRAYADLLIEIGDAAAAISALERVATEEPAGSKERAALQLRIGRLIEEHLLKPDDALKRYRAAAEMDASNKDAWSAIRAISRQRGDRALLVESLRGLAGAESDAKEKASLFRQIAKVERDERADVGAAEKAFNEALAVDNGDVESLMSLAALLSARLQPDVDLDNALAQPNEPLLEALRPPVLKAMSSSSSSSLPLSLRRLAAMALSRSGERQQASQRFDEILQETPEDLATLMALARHLAAAPKTESGADGRRLRCLETILLHHAYSLKPPVQVDVWGEVTALRAATGDGAGARKAAKKVMALASTDELRLCLSDRAVRAVALALDDARDTERDPKSIIGALKLDADRSMVETERARLLERAAAIAHDELKDRVLARALLEDAVRAAPASQSAREALLDLDISSGDVAGALKQVRDLLNKEADPKRKALLHLRLFRMRKKLGLDLEGAAVELRSAVELDSSNGDILDAAEQFFTEKNDPEGLDKLWSAQLRNVDRADVRGRLKLLERLAQLRRYERRDLAGAVEALEAMTALDPEAIKPREDAARLYTELGLAREAVAAWRGVLERDPLCVEAWRGIFGRFAYTRQGDEAFAVASTMVALDLADDDIARAVRTIRPPFPRWPIPPKDQQLFRRKVSHPLERAPIRAVLDVAAPRLLPHYARKLKDFGFHKRDAMPEKAIPTSVLLAVRTLTQLLGLKEQPPIFQAELGSSDGQSPPFAVLPSIEPGIIVTAEVIKGGMTPERAFALGRAASWLQPHAVMAAAVDPSVLRSILEGLTSAFLGAKSLERPDLDAEKLGKELSHTLLHGLSQADETLMKGELLPALRDYVHARQQVQVADWRAGVGYSGDRVGFLLSTDLNAAFRLIKSTAGSGQSIGARLAIKELVLFSVSSSYMALRKDLGLALPELAAAPLLDLG